MESTNVLLIEGRQSTRQTSFAHALRERYALIHASTGVEARQKADQSPPEVIVVNAATMRSSGERICYAMHNQCNDTPIIYIQKKDQKKFASQQVDMVLVMPFTARKLINRIERFIAKTDGKVIKAGPFQLNPQSRILQTPSGEKRLTPKLAVLIELFIRNPDRTLKREAIMQHVWQTDYMGDTRTLDVHIRWVREAIEPNPGKPVFLRTIRGTGYRLDIQSNG